MTSTTHVERLVLIGCITDPVYAAKAFPILHDWHFTSQFTRTVFRWCAEHYKAYSRPPGRTIQEIYNRAREDKTETEAVLDLVGTFLASISRELDEDRERIDTAYLLDCLTDFSKARNIEELRNSLDIALQNDTIDEAEAAVSQFAQVSLSDIAHVDLCADPEKAYAVFQESLNRTEGDSLFRFPGDMAKQLGSLQRGDLAAFAAPSKRGKTWWMQEAAVLAAQAGNSVVVFSLEMSAGQIVSRITRRLARRPRAAQVVTVPSFDGEIVTYEEKVFDAGLRALTQDQIVRIYQHLQSHGGGLVVQSYPAYAASVSDLKSFLNYLETACSYKADVVIVDYADIIRPDYRGEYRHQIDHTWKTLRSMAQEKDVLLITATHTNKTTFKKNIGQGDLSEDARKLNHVSVMVGLNQTEAEKRMGFMRASVLASRHDNFNSEDEVLILQCLDLACPVLDSRFKHEVRNYEALKDGALPEIGGKGPR